MDTQVNYSSIQEKEFKKKYTPRIISFLESGFKHHDGLSLGLAGRTDQATSNIKIKGKSKSSNVSLSSIFPSINRATFSFQTPDGAATFQSTDHDISAAWNFNPFEIATIILGETQQSKVNAYAGTRLTRTSTSMILNWKHSRDR